MWVVWVAHRSQAVVIGLCIAVGWHRCTLHLDGVRYIERSRAGNVPITPLTQTLTAWVYQALSKVPV
jgi:hypothetical protein